MKKIIITVISASAFILISVIAFNVWFTEEKNLAETGKTTADFDDGSYIVDIGIYEYEHILFDGNKIRFNGIADQTLILNDENSFNFSDAENHIIIESYSFSSESKAIALHYFTVGDSSAQSLYSVCINGMNYYIVKEIYSLLLLSDCREQQFNSYNDLYEYCKTENINLSDRYHCASFGSEPETVQEICGGYSIVSFPYDFKSIRLNNEDIYIGLIEDLEIKDSEFSFKLTVPKNQYYPYSVNCNKDLSLKNPDSFNKLQVLFGKDNLYSDTVTVIR